MTDLDVAMARLARRLENIADLNPYPEPSPDSIRHKRRRLLEQIANVEAKAARLHDHWLSLQAELKALDQTQLDL